MGRRHAPSRTCPASCSLRALKNCSKRCCGLASAPKEVDRRVRWSVNTALKLSVQPSFGRSSQRAKAKPPLPSRGIKRVPPQCFVWAPWSAGSGSSNLPALRKREDGIRFLLNLRRLCTLYLSNFSVQRIEKLCMARTGFRLEQLFGSQTRARLLGLFLLHPDKAFFVRELTRKINAQLNSVRRELQNLMQLGLVAARGAETPARRGASLAEKKKYYIAN